MWKDNELIFLQASTPPETLLETLSILSILVTRFPLQVSALSLHPPPVQIMVPLLGHSRPAVRKRVILTLGEFIDPANTILYLTAASTISPKRLP